MAYVEPKRTSIAEIFYGNSFEQFEQFERFEQLMKVLLFPVTQNAGGFLVMDRIENRKNKTHI